MADISIVNGVYKPIYNYGGTTLYVLSFRSFLVFRVLTLSESGAALRNPQTKWRFQLEF